MTSRKLLRLARFPRVRRFARDAEGAVVVEFALILPLFVIFVFAVMEFARAYQAMNAVISAAREGARVAAVAPDPTSAAWADSAKKRAKAVASSMFTTDTIVVANPTCDGAVPNACRVVTVSTSMTLKGISPLFAMVGMSGGIPLSGQASFRWERAEDAPAGP
jgi:Flp pilus assembly protein TadG